MHRPSRLEGIAPWLAGSALAFGAGLLAGRQLGSSAPSTAPVLAPPPTPGPTPAVRERHVMPRWHQVIRYVFAGSVLVGVIYLIAIILSGGEDGFDGVEVAGVAYSIATLAVVYAFLHRYERDLFCLVVLIAGLLPAIAALLTFSPGNTTAIVWITLGAGAATVLAFILEASGFGRSVWLWEDSDWPNWTFSDLWARLRGRNP